MNGYSFNEVTQPAVMRQEWIQKNLGQEAVGPPPKMSKVPGKETFASVVGNLAASPNQRSAVLGGNQC